MAVTEVKMEPIEDEEATQYEETILNKISIPQVNKVNAFLCTKIIAQLLCFVTAIYVVQSTFS